VIPFLEHLDLTEETVLGLRLLRPRDPEALLSEEEFARDEFLPYWAELWPSALELAAVVETRNVAGARVLELGCGLGVPSLVGARGGAHVLATDWADDAILLLRENARRNGIALDAAVVDWREAAPLLERAPFDVVLAADVLYERRYVDVLLELLPRLGGEVLFADPGRPFTDRFLERWQVEPIGDRVHRLVTPRDAVGRSSS
jgi:predicted nicotinamide N-methyase